MKIEFTENDYNNLMVFLDRVECKGLKEIHAMQTILNALMEGNERNNERRE